MSPEAAETLYFFISRSGTVTDIRLIIVHHHGVNINADDIRLYSETPYEKFLQNFPENPHFEYGKGFAETFYGAGGGRTVLGRFNCPAYPASSER